MNRYLSEARKIHRKAVEELEHGIWYGEELEIRNAAEKAWLATVNAMDALLFARGIEVPIGREAHQKRFEKFMEWSIGNPDLKSLLDSISSVQNILHGGCFYYGFCTPIEFISEMIKDHVKKIIDEIGYMINGRR